MSQQAAAGRGAGRGGGRKLQYYPQGGGVNLASKTYKLTISKIALHKFNTGQNMYAAQFMQSCNKVTNYLQQTLADKGYLVVETIQTRKKQSILLPPPVDANAPDKADLDIIQAEDVKRITKRRQKQSEALKKGYATVYRQCSQEVRNKLKSTENWEATQKEQSLHKLILKVKRICVGFDDHKQEVFNLVQVLKTLFLYTQGKKEMVEEYGRKFKSLWDTMEAFGGLPGIHKGLTDSLLAATVTSGSPTAAQIKQVGEELSKAVKAALLISRANRQRYGALKDALANNYLLGSNQDPDTLEKGVCILGNYQTTKVVTPFRASPNDTGVAFLQRGSKGGQGGACGGRGGRGGDKTEGGSDTRGNGNEVSTMTNKTGERGTKTNSNGESHCFDCGATSHWAYECPQLCGEQQAQLHKNLDSQEDEQAQEQAGEEGHQMLHVSMAQGGDLPDDQAYLDECSTVTAFKNVKLLRADYAQWQQGSR